MTIESIRPGLPDTKAGSTPLRGKLRTVEMGRGIAAIAVVMFHANGAAIDLGLSYTRWASPLQFGVDFFFVLSGFIIFYIHSPDIGHRRKAGLFAFKRVARLYPVLWFVAGGWIAANIVFGGTPTLSQIGTSLLLYPSTTEPLPTPVWTLRHEALFYLAFGVAIVSRRAGLVIGAVWGSAIVMQVGLVLAGRPIEGVMGMVLSSYGLDFLMGAGVAYFVRNRRLDSWWPFVIGLVLVIVCAVLFVEHGLQRDGTNDYTSFNTLMIPFVGASFAVLLYGMLCIEHRLKVPEWAVFLGSASYAIYLVHTPINGVIFRIAKDIGDGYLQLLLLLGGIFGGIAVHLLFERPVAKMLRCFAPNQAKGLWSAAASITRPGSTPSFGPKGYRKD